MKSSSSPESSPFQLIRSELESAEAQLQASDVEEKTRLKEAQDLELRAGSREKAGAELARLSLETLTFEDEVVSSFDHVSEMATQARGRKVYRLIRPDEARKNELIARVLAEVAKPQAA